MTGILSALLIGWFIERFAFRSRSTRQFRPLNIVKDHTLVPGHAQPTVQSVEVSVHHHQHHEVKTDNPSWDIIGFSPAYMLSRLLYGVCTIERKIRAHARAKGWAGLVYQRVYRLV